MSIYREARPQMFNAYKLWLNPVDRIFRPRWFVVIKIKKPMILCAPSMLSSSKWTEHETQITQREHAKCLFILYSKTRFYDNQTWQTRFWRNSRDAQRLICFFLSLDYAFRALIGWAGNGWCVKWKSRRNLENARSHRQDPRKSAVVLKVEDFTKFQPLQFLVGPSVPSRWKMEERRCWEQR